MLRILPVASGSTGNCMLLEIDGRLLVIDLGVSASMLRSAMSANGFAWEDVDAVLITHTHSDHIRGLGVCMKRIHAPIFMSHTSKNTLMLESAAALNYSARTEILPDLWVTAIPTSHDCPGSVGFLIETADTRFGYLTDLGVIPEGVMDLFSGCDCIVLESNHDEEMLRYGPYPAYLKKRILSEHGHLSNEACAEALALFAERGTGCFCLAHLSRENNRPSLALESARKATAGRNVQLEVLPIWGERMITVAVPSAPETKKPASACRQE